MNGLRSKNSAYRKIVLFRASLTWLCSLGGKGEIVFFLDSQISLGNFKKKHCTVTGLAI